MAFPLLLKERKTLLGFTLAELLIALAILGVIATFTIPKILSSQQNGRNNSLAKEAAAMIAGAYSQYGSANGYNSSVGIQSLTQYLNYLKVDSATTIDDPTGGAYVCGSGGKSCLVLHNGAYLLYNPTITFSGTSTTNGLYFGIDPNGVQDGSASQGFILTYNGQIISYGEMTATYTFSSGTKAPGNANATWFSW